jgi:hypothetical protein
MAHGIVFSHAIGTLTGHATPVLNFPEAASQVFLAGDFVYLASGYLTLCGADPALIMGIALEPAHNTTAGLYRIGVALALEITLFGVSVYHATAGNNLIEATDLGLLCDIAMSAAGKWVADKAVVTTTSRLRILKFVDPLATVSGIVAGVIAATNRQIGFVGA